MYWNKCICDNKRQFIILVDKNLASGFFRMNGQKLISYKQVKHQMSGATSTLQPGLTVKWRHTGKYKGLYCTVRHSRWQMNIICHVRYCHCMSTVSQTHYGLSFKQITCWLFEKVPVVTLTVSQWIYRSHLLWDQFVSVEEMWTVCGFYFYQSVSTCL